MFRKRIYLSLILIISLILNMPIYNFTAAAMPVKTVNKTGESKKIILIDPGHGGIDGGAVSRTKTLEKTINLKISLKLKDYLMRAGYEVIMTREEDKGLYNSRGKVSNMKREDLNKRCRMKAESKCNLFISIHQNFFHDPKYSGAQIWYSNSKASKHLAGIIQKNLRTDLDNNNSREEKAAQDDYKILRCHLEIPSVIVECGFLTNPKEEKLLCDESYQQIIAESISKSIIEYFQNSLQ